MNVKCIKKKGIKVEWKKWHGIKMDDPVIPFAFSNNHLSISSFKLQGTLILQDYPLSNGFKGGLFSFSETVDYLTKSVNGNVSS